jgi:hypothetical protein
MHNPRRTLTPRLIILYIIGIDLDYVAGTALELDANINGCRKWWKVIAGGNRYFSLFRRQGRQCTLSRLYYLEYFGRTDEGGQGGRQCCRKDPCSDEGPEPGHHAHDLEKRVVWITQFTQQTVWTANSSWTQFIPSSLPVIPTHKLMISTLLPSWICNTSLFKIKWPLFVLYQALATHHKNI